jgi:hypothetical protein
MIYTTIPWAVLSIVYVPLVLVALLLGVIGIWEMVEQKLLRKRLTATAEGFPTMTIAAAVTNSSHVVFANQSFRVLGNNDAVNNPREYQSSAGEFIWLEFQAEDELYYQVCTQKPYQNAAQIKSLTIQYNPQQPAKEYVIDGFYSHSNAKGKVIGAAVLLSIEAFFVIMARLQDS